MDASVPEPFICFIFRHLCVQKRNGVGKGAKVGHRDVDFGAGRAPVVPWLAVIGVSRNRSSFTVPPPPLPPPH